MKILSPAKINLFLQINAKRSDGYHDIESLMCCISLYDTIYLEFGTNNIRIQCTNAQVPQNEDNLAFRAARLFFDKLNKNEGIKISIEKRIPVAAGLGGGSSNAAGVLMGLNRFYGYPFSQNQLMLLGAALGADVPFFIMQKPAIATGFGDKLTPYSNLSLYYILLISQGFGVSTAEVYRKLNLRLTKCKKKLTKAPLKYHGFDAAFHLCNDLEAVTISKYPEIKSAKRQLLQHGALGALMSGSGPSVFGIFSDLPTAKKAENALSSYHHGQLYLANILVDSSVIILTS
jgi:4-diphosphocytidyl-2-C-methyl-D-erythritol kinase